MEQTQLVIIGESERKLENLQTMLESVDMSRPILTFNSCHEAMTKMDAEDQAVVFIDYRNPEKRMDNAISELIMHRAVNHIVLLQSRNAHKTHFTHYTTSEVVFDDLSLNVLQNLMRNIQNN